MVLLHVLAQKKRAKQHREERTSGRPAFSTLARRFLAPQEQGGDARPEAQPAVPAFSAFGPMETRARPMSREHGRCRCARSTLFALRGKSASELARLILVCHGREAVCGTVCPSRAVWQARREDGSMPFCAPRSRRVPATIPRGEWRALPAPAQGIHPLRIPFWGTASVSLPPPSPKRRRRQAPAPEPAAVYSHPPPQPNQNAATPPHS